MTKEKPIGLIVGLFFIIVFGLILSELTGTSATLPPPPGALEENVDAYSRTPMIEDYTPYNPGPVISPTRGTLGPDAVVDVRMSRPGTLDRGGVIEAELMPDAAVLAATQPPPADDDSLGHVAPIPDPGPTHAAGGTIYVGPGGVSSQQFPGRAAEAQARARTRTYVVKPGDTLTGIARKFYGAGRGREYKRIFAANRDSMRTESSLSIGQKLTIPPLGSADGGAAGRGAHGRYSTVSLGELSGTLLAMGRKPASMAVRTYVVQRGDCLTGIARRLMRDDSPAAVRKLFEANRNVLSSRDRLRIGVELKLPR